jgi:hypothetical protein
MINVDGVSTPYCQVDEKKHGAVMLSKQPDDVRNTCPCLPGAFTLQAAQWKSKWYSERVLALCITLLNMEIVTSDPELSGLAHSST